MTEKKCFIGITLLLSFLFIAGFLVPAMGAEKAQEGKGIYRPSAIMVIQTKERGLISTKRSRFVITSGTKITDSSGMALTIRSLPVPCEAEVEYEPYPHGDPVARKIVLRRVFPGATTNWSIPMPE